MTRIPFEGEGLTIVDHEEAIYVFGSIPMSWLQAINDVASDKGFDILDVGAGESVGAWVFTNKDGSEKVRAVIEERNKRLYDGDMLQGWLHGCDTGTSSKTIAHVLAGTPLSHGSADIPYDPDDFGRCLRLVRLMGWRDRLHEVAERYPKTAWPGIVERWDEIADLFDEETPTGKAPRCYALMREIRGRP